MGKHTPEPWEVELMADRTGDWFSIEAPMAGRSGTVADTSNRDSVIGPDEDRANAYLMSAAPEMLKTLRDIRESVCASLCPDTWRRADPQPHGEECKAIRAAIAKALGEQP